VIAIATLLVAILLPGLRNARIQAKVLQAHADLRQITVALDAYAMDNMEQVPPTRSACGTNVNNQLPVELAENGFLPPSPSLIPQAQFSDVFNPDHTYKYLAPGAIWYNGTFFDYPEQKTRPRAKIWVPDDFPRCESDQGRFYAHFAREPRSPAVYAVWSIGPDPRSRKFPRFEGSSDIDESKFPLPKAFWMLGASDTGLITLYKARKGGAVHISG